MELEQLLATDPEFAQASARYNEVKAQLASTFGDPALYFQLSDREKELYPQVYSKAVHIVSQALLGQQGKDGEELLGQAARLIINPSAWTLAGANNVSGFFRDIAIKTAELASQPQGQSYKELAPHPQHNIPGSPETSKQVGIISLGLAVKDIPDPEPVNCGYCGSPQQKELLELETETNELVIDATPAPGYGCTGCGLKYFPWEVDQKFFTEAIQLAEKAGDLKGSERLQEELMLLEKGRTNK